MGVVNENIITESGKWKAHTQLDQETNFVFHIRAAPHDVRISLFQFILEEYFCMSVSQA